MSWGGLPKVSGEGYPGLVGTVPRSWDEVWRGWLTGMEGDYLSGPHEKYPTTMSHTYHMVRTMNQFAGKFGLTFDFRHIIDTFQQTGKHPITLSGPAA